MFMTNKKNPIITNSLITEYDMKHGNTSILREFELVPFDTLDKWDELPGELRQKKVGIYAKKHPELKIFEFLEEKFDFFMNQLIMTNSVDEDEIVSIKRDALFVRGKELRNTHFGKYIYYRPKNTYKHFLLLDGKEFYVAEDGTFDIKGISDELIEKHRSGILEFIWNFLETFEYDTPECHRYCKGFVRAYKRKELPWEYYRELNQESMYIARTSMGDLQLDSMDESMGEYLDILYNYTHIVIPLIQFLF